MATGAAISFYRWGEVGDGVAGANPSIPAAQPVLDPAGKRFGSNLTAAIERTYRDQLASDTSATLLRYLGARDVVVQNDLDWQRSRTVRPAVLQLLVRDPSLGALHAFGTRGQNVLGSTPSAKVRHRRHLQKSLSGRSGRTC